MANEDIWDEDVMYVCPLQAARREIHYCKLLMPLLANST